MKKLTEEIIRKDSTIAKVQFDKEWFYAVKDMEDYLNEDLSGVEAVKLPVIIDGVKYNVSCATWEDIMRVLKKEPLEDFKNSVLRSRKK